MSAFTWGDAFGMWHASTVMPTNDNMALAARRLRYAIRRELAARQGAPLCRLRYTVKREDVGNGNTLLTAHEITR